MDAVLGKPIDLAEILQQMETLVPAGRGRFNPTLAADATQDLPAALAPLAQLVNLPRALRLWGDAQVYRLALEEFCTAHGSDGQRIVQQLDTALELGRRMAHTLKGVAANLQPSAIAKLASAVDAAIKADNLAQARQCAQLQLDFDQLLELVELTCSSTPAADTAAAAPATQQEEVPELLLALRSGPRKCQSRRCTRTAQPSGHTCWAAMRTAAAGRRAAFRLRSGQHTDRQPDPQLARASLMQKIILAIDDEPNNLNLLLQVMRDKYRLVFANNGAKGLELAAAYSPT
jgi:HPt (histidine-containing phosphotransfer) domain-containing protein